MTARTLPRPDTGAGRTVAGYVAVPAHASDTDA